MDLIVITSEKEVKDEAVIINELFYKGLSVLHFRKPYISKEMTMELLSQIDAGYRHRVVLHDHFDLRDLFTIKGIHLNMRNRDIPEKFRLSVSKSCHSFDSLKDIERFDYVFLSPLYKSISKQGYVSDFSHEELMEACGNNIINEKVIALGGVNMSNLEKTAEYGFGGVAVLGVLWNEYECTADKGILIKKFMDLKDKCSRL